MHPGREAGKGKGTGCWFAGKVSAPVCAFCRQQAAGNLVFGDNAAVGMNATLGGNGRTVTFHYGSDHDGDVCVLRRDVTVPPGDASFSLCDDCAETMFADGRLVRKTSHLAGKTYR